MSKLQYTAIANSSVLDKLMAMQSTQLITPDVSTAFCAFTYFKFPPCDYQTFHDAVFWDQPILETLPIAVSITEKFNNWYRSANDFEKTVIGVAALTDSWEQIDDIVNDSFQRLSKPHLTKMVDADGTVFDASNYSAMWKDVDALVNSAHINWWCRRFEEQVQRVVAMPMLPMQDVKDYYQRLYDSNRAIEERYSLYSRSGVRHKDARRVFNRSHRLFVRTFGEKAARKFLKNKTLLIPGQYFVWKLKLVVGVYRETLYPTNISTPFRITVCDQGLNALANACVLFLDTPPLDQAVAFSLHLTKAEDEIEFAKTANFFNVTELGRTHELLMSMPNISFVRHFGAIDPTDGNHVYDPPYVQCPTVDDGWDEPRSLESDREFLLRYYEQLKRDLTEYDDPDDDYARAFAREYDRDRSTLIGWGNTEIGEEQKQRQRNLDDMWRIEHRVVRRERAKNPIRTALREKILAKLDVDPDILHYMMFPELRFCVFMNVEHAPLLEGYIGAKIPFRERNF